MNLDGTSSQAHSLYNFIEKIIIQNQRHDPALLILISSEQP